MLPGKQYMPEDVLKILRKRFWVIVVPWAVVAAATAAVARKLPDLYRSTALIQVVPPQVPGSLVQPMTTVRFEDRLQATQQIILSRTRLESIIKELNLYQAEQKTMMMDEVVGRFRNDIRVQPTKGDSFTVQYIGRNPVTVMKVTERLAGYFKDESVKEGERRAEGTSNFIESQVEEAHRKLLETEDKLKNYQMRHVGELPEQATANMQAIQTITMNLNALNQAITNDTTTKSMLERQIEVLESQAEPAAPPPQGSDVTAATGTAAQRLAAAKAQLQVEQLTGKKPDHPTIKWLNDVIARLEKEANEEALRAPVGAAVAASPTEQARLTRLAGYRDDVSRLGKQIAANQAEEKRLRALAASYQAKLDQVPVRGAELTELTREYGTLTDIYKGLVAKREQSNMSVNLERRQGGEQFNLIDPARLPQSPFSPDRFMINLIGMVGGLAIGLALVALLEYRDNTFKTDSEIAHVVGLPVLAVVPLMRSEEESRAAFRRKLLLNVGLSGAVTVCLAVLAYTFVFMR